MTPNQPGGRFEAYPYRLEDAGGAKWLIFTSMA